MSTQILQGGIAKNDCVHFTCFKSQLKQNIDLRPLVESVKTHVGMGTDIISMATNKMLVDMLLDNQATLLPIHRRRKLKLGLSQLFEKILGIMGA